MLRQVGPLGRWIVGLLTVGFGSQAAAQYGHVAIPPRTLDEQSYQQAAFLEDEEPAPSEPTGRATEHTVRALPPAGQPTSRPLQMAESARAIPLARQASEGTESAPGLALPPLATGATSLGIVLGVFVLVVWVAKRSGPRGAAQLPAEAVEVLGRAPLAGRQQMHLVRCGNKLLLVSVSPGSVETLTEISDPEEVDRLLGVCAQARGGASFRQVLQQLKSPGDHRLRANADQIDFGHLELAAHRAQESRG